MGQGKFHTLTWVWITENELVRQDFWFSTCSVEFFKHIKQLFYSSMKSSVDGLMELWQVRLEANCWLCFQYNSVSQIHEDPIQPHYYLVRSDQHHNLSTWRSSVRIRSLPIDFPLWEPSVGHNPLPLLINEGNKWKKIETKFIFASCTSP